MAEEFHGQSPYERQEHEPANKAKKVDLYVWNSGTLQWEKMTQPGASTLGGSGVAQKDDTYYGDGVTSGVASVAIRHFDGSVYNRTPAQAVRLDDTTTTNVTYVGKAPIGTATSAASWQIVKIDETSGLIETWADGNGSFDNVWDNRASLTYS